jgi:hypothetical protein
MVLNYEYHNSAGILRWNLGWASPTYAGAFLGTLIPYAWALEKTATTGAKKWHYLSLAFEFALVFLLCKTQSRGALAALILASAYWHFFAVKGRRWRRFALRMILLAGCVWLAGFSSRIEPNFVAKDLSIKNRLILWKGSLKVFALTPASGGGVQSSGRLYRDWFESPDRLEGYKNPINSYLFAAIEYPIAISGPILFLLVLAVIATPQRPEADQGTWPDLSLAASSAIVAWNVASVFSTIWDEYPLWVVPIVSLAIIIRNAVYKTGIGKDILAALGLTLALGGSAKAMGWELLQREKIIPQILGDGVVQLNVAHQGRNSWPTCHIWLDDEVLGYAPEKELRRWLSLEGSPSVVVVHDRWADPKFDPREGDVVVLVGRSAERLFTSLNRKYSRVVLIHPNVPRRDSSPLPANAVLMIPEIDQDGSLDGIREAAGPHLMKIVTPGVGIDIRLAWPAVMEKIDQLYSGPRIQ